MILRIFRRCGWLCTLILLAALAPLGAAAESTEAKWAFVGFTKYRDGLFIDMNRLTDEADQRRQVWSRITPAEHSGYIKRIRRNLMQAGKNSGEFRYVEILNELNCQDRRIRYLKGVYFHRDGRVIHAVGDDAPVWKAVHAGSLWDSLLTAVCR
jgi:hypothetical protein